MSIAHPPVGQLASGVPRSEVSRVLSLEENVLGIDARSKNQIL